MGYGRKTVHQRMDCSRRKQTNAITTSSICRMMKMKMEFRVRAVLKRLQPNKVGSREERANDG